MLKLAVHHFLVTSFSSTEIFFFVPSAPSSPVRGALCPLWVRVFPGQLLNSVPATVSEAWLLLQRLTADVAI